MVDKKLVLIGAAAIALALIVLLVIFPTASQQESTSIPFLIQKYGNAGGQGFVIYSAAAKGNLTILSYSSKPSKTVFVVNEKGFGNEKFESFIGSLRGLEHFGFNITEITPATEVTNGILLVPTGAMPAWTLKSVSTADPTNLHVIYIGRKDMVLDGTVKQSDWFGVLSPNAASAVSVIDMLPDEMVEKKLVGQLANEILEARWAILNNKSIGVNGGNKADATSGAGNKTMVLDMKGGTFMRVIPIFCSSSGSASSPSDSECYRQAFDFNTISLQTAQISINDAVFPWEKAEVLVYLNKTNGTANMRIEKDGVVVESKELERVTEEEAGIIPLRVGFEEAGDYIITISDNSGDIGSAVLHVKSLIIKLNETRDGLYHQFDVILDGERADGLEFNVSLLNSTEKKKAKILATGGSVTIPAKLGKGLNIFVFEGLGGEVFVKIDNTSENIYDIYLKYGPIGLLLIVIAYIAARFGRKPIYIIRVGDIVTEKRQNLAISSKKVLSILQGCRNELSITGPITALEFATGIKKHFTDGADITEGNAEVILRRMEVLNLVEGRNGFYQLVGEGDIRTNALKRQIREKLIAKGIHFDVNGDKFIARDFELGFFGDRFSKK